MALIRANTNGGGGSSTIKDIIRDKVFNGGFTSICTLTPHLNRATLNEGGVVADTTNHRVYVYVDITINENSGSSSDYSQLFSLDNISTNYYPKYNTASRNNNVALTTDESSANPLRQFYFGYNAESYSNKIVLSYGSGSNAIKTGERYILYTIYSYQ